MTVVAELSYDEYLKTKAWKKRREEAIDRAGGRCQICNSDRDLQVHHRTYERIGDEDPADLTVLCDGCHGHFHIQRDEAKAQKSFVLSVQERREQALLAMCIADWESGRECLANLQDHLLTPLARRAKAWLEVHLEDPLDELPHDDGNDEFVSLVTQLVMRAEREPEFSGEAMTLNMLQLEQRWVEAEIDKSFPHVVPVHLQRRRAELVERIAGWEQP